MLKCDFSGKNKLPSERKAKSIIKKMYRSRSFGGRTYLNAYRCEACGHWHVGSSMNENKKERKKYRRPSREERLPDM